MTSSTEERVRDAAVRLFAQRGYHGTGIRDLARAAGVSSASLYHYMGTKEELLASIMRESLERLVDAAHVVVGSSADPTVQLAGLVSMHVREHADSHLETTVVDGEIRSLTEPYRAEILALRDRYESIWGSVLDAGQRSGAFSHGDPQVTRLAALEMCSGVSRWYSPGGRLDLDDVTSRYVDLVLRLVSG